MVKRLLAIVLTVLAIAGCSNQRGQSAYINAMEEVGFTSEAADLWIARFCDAGWRGPGQARIFIGGLNNGKPSEWYVIIGLALEAMPYYCPDAESSFDFLK